MRANSNRTFHEEQESFQPIKGIFWESPDDYPDPFRGILEGLPEDSLAPPGYLNDPQYVDRSSGQLDRRPLGRGGLVVLDRPGVVESIGKAAKRSDSEFSKAFWTSFGIDIEEVLEDREASGKAADEGKLQTLTATFGTDAFGTYCPWHAFGRSERTPWGIYIFLEKLIDEAWLLYSSGKFLPAPKPSILSVFRFLWWLTYRHELFHFHVELFATRIESALRVPRYRPYVENVQNRVAHTDQWWEEALAQAAVLESQMVKRTLGISAKYMKDYVVPYFRTFPEGYKRFECNNVAGGVSGAHRLLSTQVARNIENPPVEERNTDLALAKLEYGTASRAVPGYLILRSGLYSRFQLQTPRLADTLRFVEGKGEFLGRGKGDHTTVRVNGHVLDINRAKRGNTIDLPSAKALAKALEIKVFALVHEIG
jgi:hypothetical protein